MGFPADFTWGAASSAYQIEGAAAEDGKGRSVWDAFCEIPGNVAGRHHGLVACDHYHRFREDVRMMKDLGVRAYRFSISWPRILPEGKGAVYPAGIAFYDRLVDELLENGIEPWATLFHWDFPEALMADGGWLNREVADGFADYAAVMAHRLSDRVRHWMTLNEPQCFIGFGHCTGSNAPGLKLSHAECLQAGHHVLLAHGKAVQALRSFCAVPPLIGWAPVGVVSMPASDDPKDIEAARNSMFSVHGGDSRNMGMHANLWSNTWWGDPVVFGTYPEDGILAAGDDMPVIEEGDMEIISQPIDFYGTNIYTGALYREGLDGNPCLLPHPDGVPLSAFKWPITPPSLRWGPRFLHERYGLPVIVTENGVSLADWVSIDGAVHDPQRIDFMRRYLGELENAIADGADVRGYFHWSIMDNFEWAEGYRQRFGLVHVDYETQVRTPKDSAFWYRDFIRSQSAPRA